jgi:hypothetical protein
VREKGKVDQDHYFWLVATWENLFLSCTVCARLRGNYFPINSQSVPGTSLNQLRRQREGILLDPAWDHPEHSFFIGPKGELYPRNGRAEATISAFDLNRIDLMKARERSIEMFVKLWGSFAAGIGREGEENALREMLQTLGHDRPYIGAIYIYLWQISNRSTQRLIRSIIDSGPSTPTVPRLLDGIGDSLPNLLELGEWLLTRRAARLPLADERFHDRFLPISKVTIKNFKGIHELTLHLRDAKDNRHAIVAENAAGKTSVLQAISLGLAGPSYANSLIKDPHTILPDDAEEGYIEISFAGTDEKNVLEFSRKWRRFRGRLDRRVKVYGYGPYRLLAKQGLGKSKRNPSVRLHSLFEDGAKLNGFHGWLDKLRPSQRKDLGEVLQILLSSSKTKVSVDSQTLHIATNGKNHPIHNLSSGMQSVVSFCTDVLEAVYANDESILRGDYVVIVDELSSSPKF